MFAVVVHFRLRPGTQSEFRELVRRNARASLSNEPGCHQFDVCVDDDRPDEVFLYELYTDRSAFDAHLTMEHFLKFDQTVAPMIVEKVVSTYRDVTQ